MKPCIISSIPYTRPDGAKTYSAHLSKVMEAPLFIPPWDDVEPIFSSCDPYAVTDEIKGDYTILCGPFSNAYLQKFPDRIDWVKTLPKPLIVTVNDGENLSLRYSTFWDKIGPEIAYCLVSRYSIGDLLAEKRGKKWVHIEYPYVLDEILPRWYAKKDRIISAGRLVDVKGHRLVATLARYDYDVVIAGSTGAGSPKFEEKLYLDMIKDLGAEVCENPSREAMQLLFAKSSIYMTLGCWPEQECGVEYTAFEAMSFGCIPIVGRMYERHYHESGLRYFAVESYMEAMPYIDMIFREKEVALEMSAHNHNVLRTWASTLPGLLEDIALAAGGTERR